MNIQAYTAWNEAEILSLYASVGWTAYTDHPDVLREGFRHSLLTLAAYEGDQLVGLIRVVGDGVTLVFVQDLLVSPAFQRRGVGSALMQAILERYQSVRQIELATDDLPETTAFYQTLGFQKMSDVGCCGMIRLAQN